MRTLHSGWSKDLCLPELCKHPFSSWNPRTDLCLASQCLTISLHSLVFGHKPTAMPLVILGSWPLKTSFLSSRVKSQHSRNLVCPHPPHLSYIAVFSLHSMSLQAGPENNPGGKKIQSRLTASFASPGHHIPSSGWSRGHKRALINISVE